MCRYTVYRKWILCLYEPPIRLYIWHSRQYRSFETIGKEKKRKGERGREQGAGFVDRVEVGTTFAPSLTAGESRVKNLNHWVTTTISTMVTIDEPVDSDLRIDHSWEGSIQRSMCGCKGESAFVLHEGKYIAMRRSDTWENTSFANAPLWS